MSSSDNKGETNKYGEHRRTDERLNMLQRKVDRLDEELHCHVTDDDRHMPGTVEAVPCARAADRCHVHGAPQTRPQYECGCTMHAPIEQRCEAAKPSLIDTINETPQTDLDALTAFDVQEHERRTADDQRPTANGWPIGQCKHGVYGLCAVCVQEGDYIYEPRRNDAQKEPSGCPCRIVEPCGPCCTCANEVMSGGCRRCARYGSNEQRFAAADAIANAIDLAERRRPDTSPGDLDDLAEEWWNDNRNRKVEFIGVDEIVALLRRVSCRESPPPSGGSNEGGTSMRATGEKPDPVGRASGMAGTRPDDTQLPTPDYLAPDGSCTAPREVGRSGGAEMQGVDPGARCDSSGDDACDATEKK